MITIKQALERFREECCERWKQIDPSEEQDWFSLSLGFFIAIGLTPTNAHRAAVEARYTHQYWK